MFLSVSFGCDITGREVNMICGVPGVTITHGTHGAI